MKFFFHSKLGLSRPPFLQLVHMNQAMVEEEGAESCSQTMVDIGVRSLHPHLGSFSLWLSTNFVSDIYNHQWLNFMVDLNLKKQVIFVVNASFDFEGKVPSFSWFS
jgi:hypothetical protein